MMKWIFIVLFPALVLTGCNNYSDREIHAFDQEIEQYLKEQHISMDKTSSGLYYHIIQEGNGDHLIRYNDVVSFYYQASFLDGNTFQVIDSLQPLQFKVSDLIVGWQDALMMLKENGKIQIIIPPQLGYGEKETGLIPPGTILQYELTVTDVQ